MLFLSIEQCLAMSLLRSKSLLFSRSQSKSSFSLITVTVVLWEAVVEALSCSLNSDRCTLVQRYDAWRSQNSQSGFWCDWRAKDTKWRAKDTWWREKDTWWREKTLTFLSMIIVASASAVIVSRTVLKVLSAHPFAPVFMVPMVVERLVVWAVFAM